MSSLYSVFFCASGDTPPSTTTDAKEKDWHIDFNEIEQLHWLGSGAHGYVFRGLYNGNTVAVKKLKELEMTQKEMQALQQLDHPHIIRVLGVCLREPSYALVMEFCPASLYDIIHKQEREIPPRLVLDYASQIARGVEYLHSKHIIHRDLKVCMVS